MHLSFCLLSAPPCRVNYLLPILLMGSAEDTSGLLLGFPRCTRGKGMLLAGEKWLLVLLRAVPRICCFVSNSEQMGLGGIFQCSLVLCCDLVSLHRRRFRSFQALLVWTALSIWALCVLASIMYSFATALASCTCGTWTCGGSPGTGGGAAWEVLCLWDFSPDTQMGKSLLEGHVRSPPAFGCCMGSSIKGTWEVILCMCLQCETLVLCPFACLRQVRRRLAKKEQTIGI